MIFGLFKRLALVFWWVEEWCEAIGNSCEDMAFVKPGHRRSPAWYRRTRGLR